VDDLPGLALTVVIKSGIDPGDQHALYPVLICVQKAQNPNRLPWGGRVRSLSLSKEPLI